MDLRIVAILLVIPLLLFMPTPMVDSINPSFGLNNEVVNVVISGDKFDKKATVKLVKPGETDIIPTDVKVISKKQLSCSFDLHGQAVGKWDLIVANRSRVTKKDKIATLVEAFTIQYPAPIVSIVEPKYGLNSEAMSANLTGTGFRAGVKVVLSKGSQSIEAMDVTVISPTQITSRFNLEKAEPGMYDVKVTNDDGKSGTLYGGFEIQYSEPIISEIEPTQGLNSETVTVSLAGTSFRAGAKVELKAEEQVIEATDVEVISDSQITAVFDLTDTVPETFDVIVTNEDGKTSSFDGGFVIEFIEPTVSEIEPSQGLTSETVSVSLTGTDFRAGAKVELNIGDQVIEATDVQVISSSEISAVFNLGDTAPGFYDVTVTNDDEKYDSLYGEFEVQYPEPILSEIEPNQGLTSETVTVRLTGTDFRAGAKVELKLGDQVIQATGVEVISSSEISAVFNLEDTVPGFYDVTVTNDDEKYDSLYGEFEITEESDVTTEDSDEITEESDVTTEDSDEITEESDVTTEDSDEATEESDVTTEDSDEAAEESDVTTEDSDEAAEEPDVNTEDSDEAAEESDITTEDSDEAAEESDVTTEDSDVAVEESDGTVPELNKLLKAIFFDFDRCEIQPDQIPALEENVKILNENPNLYILLGGHTDERGSPVYNLELSKKRAAAIRQFLLESGIDSSKISVYAYGEDHPVKKGHDESSWSFNRRVDIMVWESPPTEEQGLM